jgi:hypothetical protein
MEQNVATDFDMRIGWLAPMRLATLNLNLPDALTTEITPF